MKVGVLALQGAFREHREVFDALSVETVEVRAPEHLAGIGALVLPGGESTTMARLLATSGCFEPVRRAVADGLPVLGTCAGLVLLARTVLDGRPDQQGFGVLDVVVRRNGYGRQVASFEAPLEVRGLPGGPFPGVFIRAPRVEHVGDGVEVRARYGDDPVLVRSGSAWATAFHPELAGDLRLHQHFLDSLETT